VSKKPSCTCSHYNPLLIRLYARYPPPLGSFSNYQQLKTLSQKVRIFRNLLEQLPVSSEMKLTLLKSTFKILQPVIIRLIPQITLGLRSTVLGIHIYIYIYIYYVCERNFQCDVISLRPMVLR